MKETNRSISVVMTKIYKFKVILESMKKDDSTSKTKIVLKVPRGELKSSKVNGSHSMAYLFV